MRDLDEYQGIYNWKTNLDILSKKNWKSSSRNGHLGSKHWKWAKTRWVLTQWLGFVGKILTGTMLLTPFFVEVFCNVPIISNSGGRDAGRLWPIEMERKLPEKNAVPLTNRNGTFTRNRNFTSKHSRFTSRNGDSPAEKSDSTKTKRLLTIF